MEFYEDMEILQIFLIIILSPINHVQELFQTNATENKKTLYPNRYSRGSEEAHILWLPYEYGSRVIFKFHKYA